MNFHRNPDNRPYCSLISPTVDALREYIPSYQWKNVQDSMSDFRMNQMGYGNDISEFTYQMEELLAELFGKVIQQQDDDDYDDYVDDLRQKVEALHHAVVETYNKHDYIWDWEAPDLEEPAKVESRRNPIPCQWCGGSGKRGPRWTCTRCNGSGARTRQDILDDLAEARQSHSYSAGTGYPEAMMATGDTLRALQEELRNLQRSSRRNPTGFNYERMFEEARQATPRISLAADRQGWCCSCDCPGCAKKKEEQIEWCWGCKCQKCRGWQEQEARRNREYEDAEIDDYMRGYGQPKAREWGPRRNPICSYCGGNRGRYVSQPNENSFKPRLAKVWEYCAHCDRAGKCSCGECENSENRKDHYRCERCYDAGCPSCMGR